MAPVLPRIPGNSHYADPDRGGGMTPAEARVRLARPKIQDQPNGGTGRLADVIGAAAARDHWERREANRVLLRSLLRVRRIR